MATANRKRDAEELIRTSRGDTYMTTYIVEGATGLWEALNASGLPAYADELSGHPELQVTELRPRQSSGVKSSIDGEILYEVDVVYSYPDGSIFLPGRAVPYWTFGTTTVHITHSLGDIDYPMGHPIGSRSFFEPRESGSDSIDPINFYDEDAEIGTDIVVPTVELEVRMPLQSWYGGGASPTPAMIATYAGKCNKNDWTVDGQTILKDNALYVAATIEPVGELAQKRYVHRFIIASLQLPYDLPAYWENGTQYKEANQHKLLPIRFGYWVRFEGYYMKNTAPNGEPAVYQKTKITSAVVEDWLHNGAKEYKFKGTYCDKEPLECVLFPAYETFDFDLLGIPPEEK